MRIRENYLVVCMGMLLLSSTLALNACKKQTVAFDYFQLIGKWEMVSENCKEYIDGEPVFDETNHYQPGQPGNQCLALQDGDPYDYARVKCLFPVRKR